MRAFILSARQRLPRTRQVVLSTVKQSQEHSKGEKGEAQRKRSENFQEQNALSGRLSSQRGGLRLPCWGARPTGTGLRSSAPAPRSSLCPAEPLGSTSTCSSSASRWQSGGSAAILNSQPLPTASLCLSDLRPGTPGPSVPSRDPRDSSASQSHLQPPRPDPPPAQEIPLQKSRGSLLPPPHTHLPPRAQSRAGNARIPPPPGRAYLWRATGRQGSAAALPSRLTAGRAGRGPEPPPRRLAAPASPPGPPAPREVSARRPPARVPARRDAVPRSRRFPRGTEGVRLCPRRDPGVGWAQRSAGGSRSRGGCCRHSSTSPRRHPPARHAAPAPRAIHRPTERRGPARARYAPGDDVLCLEHGATWGRKDHSLSPQWVRQSLGHCSVQRPSNKDSFQSASVTPFWICNTTQCKLRQSERARGSKST